MKVFLEIIHSRLSFVLMLLYHCPSQLVFCWNIICEYLIPYENIEFCYLRGQKIHLCSGETSSLMWFFLRMSKWFPVSLQKITKVLPENFFQVSTKTTETVLHLSKSYKKNGKLLLKLCMHEVSDQLNNQFTCVWYSRNYLLCSPSDEEFM